MIHAAKTWPMIVMLQKIGVLPRASKSCWGHYILTGHGRTSEALLLNRAATVPVNLPNTQRRDPGHKDIILI